MPLVASSSPPFSPPPPCGDEKEEDSAEEEEADGGGGAPRDLGRAAAGRGGLWTAPLESRVLGISPQRTRSADRVAVPSSGPGPGPAPRTCPYLFYRVRIPLQPLPLGEEKKELPPTPSGVDEAPKPTPGSGAGTPSRRGDFPRILVFLAWISERIKNGRECGGTGAAFSQAA